MIAPFPNAATSGSLLQATQVQLGGHAFMFLYDDHVKRDKKV
jgi:hypothetical protein